jgi:L-aspartate oxidase
VSVAPDFTPGQVRPADVIVIGSGVAGLMVAHSAAGRRVVLLSKSAHAAGGSSPLAQGGVAASVGPGDSPLGHARDTMEAGGGLCREEVARAVTREGPDVIHRLEALGAVFDRSASGELELGREGAHDLARVVHAEGDATGAELVRALAAAVAEMDRVEVVDRVLATDLVCRRGRVVGVVCVDVDGRPMLMAANAVVLATGGIGHLFAATTNPPESTGDGLAMAGRAGATLAGLEFVQFHPTALDVQAGTKPLLTEALRGEGAALVDDRGRRIMEGVHDGLELAPRDIVARTIWNELQAGGRVYLDATHLSDRFGDRFPSVLRLCLGHGLDPRTDPMPVVPAAHYHMGGVVAGLDGSTSLPRLWAAGEVSWTGLHGANRLASNSLLEAMVTGRRIGRSLASVPWDGEPADRVAEAANRRNLAPASQPWAGKLNPVAAELRKIMWRDVGLVRSATGLRRAQLDLDRLASAQGPGSGEVANMITVARLVATAAGLRTESRGAHFRRDFPRQCRHWKQDLFFEGLRPLRRRTSLADDTNRHQSPPEAEFDSWEE